MSMNLYIFRISKIYLFFLYQDQFYTSKRSIYKQKHIHALKWTKLVVCFLPEKAAIFRIFPIFWNRIVCFMSSLGNLRFWILLAIFFLKKPFTSTEANISLLEVLCCFKWNKSIADSFHALNKLFYIIYTSTV